MGYTSFQAGESRTFQEMRQMLAPRDTFFSPINEPQQIRPTSVATEFVDMDWDEEEESSEVEDKSPRVSLQSSGQPSITTLSSYDEIPTPRSSRSREAFTEQPLKQVEGPRGPHLLGGSNQFLPFTKGNEDGILTLSPLTPNVSRAIRGLLAQPQFPRRSSPFQYTDDLDPSTLVSWTPEMVAHSMLNADIELPITERFIENDINGAILIILKFQDLKELDIPSFGIRTRIWNQIRTLIDSRSASPRSQTLIEDEPSHEAKRELKKDGVCSSRSQNSKRRQRRRSSANDSDSITPMESVSIVGIEQVIPKPHNRTKGENCSSWKKQQRLINDFKAVNSHIDINASGTVMIYGDAGNPETAKAIDPNETLRPFSDAVPSVVASSDVLGPGGLPLLQYLQEASLRNVQSRDPQDNIRQLLNFQRTDQSSNEVPSSPPFEVTPSAQPHQGLRHLPKLSIPGQKHRSSPLQQEFVPYRMDKTRPLSYKLKTANNPYRFGTPFSELYVPVTAVPIGPVARDVSQSVPPDMNHRTSPTGNHSRSQSQTSARRPFLPVLPSLDENQAVRMSPMSASPKTASPRTSVRPQQHPAQGPPRFNYPWSLAGRTTFGQAIPLISTTNPGEFQEAPAATNGISFHGPMKKRKTHMLRHEWQDGYFTLMGTCLKMHKDGQQIDRTLEYVDIDDYEIACSSAASTSKLSAAFKAVFISHNREKSDPVEAFSFQLIPQDKGFARLRKRDSSLQRGSAPVEGVNRTGKTHRFAVKSRDDRIGWMRKLMLAKALKQKGEGFEVSVNGNII